MTLEHRCIALYSLLPVAFDSRAEPNYGVSLVR